LAVEGDNLNLAMSLRQMEMLLVRAALEAVEIKAEREDRLEMVFQGF
jgi:hypothetical protein